MSNFKISLSYDDVLLIPKKGVVFSRKDVDVSTRLVGNIKLNIPIISSNMESVTESDMAIEMARIGGIGFIHRFMPIEKQVEEIKKVKRADNIIIYNPYSLSPNSTIKEMKYLMEQKKVDGFLVVSKGKLEGIVTKRDILFEDVNLKVKDVMTPFKDLIVGNEHTTIRKAKEIFKTKKIKKLPLVDKDRNVIGLITLKDIIKREMFPLATRDNQGSLRVVGSIGFKSFLEDAKKIEKAGADAIVVDIAHGHSEMMIKVLRTLKKHLSIPIIAGNVATAKGTVDLIRAGADCIKVGVGPGSICITRIVAGAGVAQFSAVYNCAHVAQKYKIPIIADGGIKNSGDIAKAIGAGASAVMIGSLFAGCDESPGHIVIRNGRKYKAYKGMASVGASMIRENKNISSVVAEGVEAFVEYKGRVKDVVHQLVGGLKSGISYSGAKNINDFWKKASFTRITSSGLRESYYHDVIKR